MWLGKTLCIATQHNKERVLGPLFENLLGLTLIQDISLNTDILGSFCGETERKCTPIEALRQKCKLAALQTNANFIVSSEGSFGPHPNIPFLYANEEFLMFYDKKNASEIIAHELFFETNFSSESCTEWNHVVEFCKRVKFPEHAVILKSSVLKPKKIVKGISNFKDLKIQFKRFIKSQPLVYIETDMRALYNPTRMNNIERLGRRLINKITSLCPFCNWPGFEIQRVIRGLPCKFCLQPTNSIVTCVWKCTHCLFEKTSPGNLIQPFVDPQFCNVCNP